MCAKYLPNAPSLTVSTMVIKSAYFKSLHTIATKN